MALDGLILHQQVTELQKLIPAKINKITQPSDTEVIFTLRSKKKNSQLLICAHSQYNRIHITKLNYINPPTPSGFLMLLRKNLENGIISEITQGGLDRYLKITINKNNEFSDSTKYYLYVELMGKYANIILCDINNKIIDALKRIPPFEDTRRPIFSGVTYQPNKKENRKNPLIDFDFDINSSLVSQYDGFSPLLAKEFDYRLHNNQDFSDIIDELTNSCKIYYYPKENDYHIIKLNHHRVSEELIFSINDGFDYIYQKTLEELRKKQLTGKLFKTINTEIKKLNRKIPKLEETYQEAINSDIYRIYGDLIFSNINDIPKGTNYTTLFDYESNKNIKIKLDPLVSPKITANKYYQKYKKGQKGQKYILEQIEKSKNKLLFFNSLNEQLEMCTTEEALQIKEEMIKQGFLKNDSKRKIKESKNKYYKINFNGIDIYYGTNSFQNDYVTFKLGRKNYLWFHAKDYHGGHILACAESLDEETLRFCANLAAYYSKGRYSSSVEVQYTHAKNLRKIPNSPLGLVSISTYKSIFIDPVKPSL